MPMMPISVKEVNEMEITPCNDHVLVTVEPDEDFRLIGLIIMPPEAGPNKKTQIGRVIAVGPGIDTRDLERPITVDIGDKVIFAMHIGYPVSLGNRGNHVLIKNNDILGIIEHEDIVDRSSEFEDAETQYEEAEVGK